MRKKLQHAGNRKFNFISVASIIALAVFSFVDLPILQMAQEIKAQTPIVRQYKVAQETGTMAPAPMPSYESAPAPAPAPAPMPSYESAPAPAPAPAPMPVYESAPAPQPAPYQQPYPDQNQQPAPYQQQPMYQTDQNQQQNQQAQPMPYPQQPYPMNQNQQQQPMPYQQQPRESTNQPQPNFEQNQQQPQQRENQQRFNEMQQKSERNIPQQNFEGEGGEQMEMEIIDPREVKNALRDIKRLQNDLKRFIKQLKKLPNSADDIAFCENLLTKLNEHYAAISKPAENESLRDALQEFWEGRYWEEIDKIRARVEIPKELNNLTKDLKKLQKLVVQKSFQKLGFDMDALKARVNEMQANLNEVKAKYAAGELEDAMEVMQEFRENGHPGEIMGVLYQMRDAKQRIKSIKNQEVRELVDELLNEVIQSFNAGDFREANMAMQDIVGELMKLASRFMKGKAVLSDEMRAKFDRLEETIQKKLGEEEKPQTSETNNEALPESMPPQQIAP